MFRNGGDEYKAALEGAVNAAKQQVALESAGKALGGIIGFTFATFFLPLVAVYAWNGMTPNGWMEWSYLPTVAGLFFIRIMIHWVRTEGK